MKFIVEVMVDSWKAEASRLEHEARELAAAGHHEAAKQKKTLASEYRGMSQMQQAMIPKLSLTYQVV